MSTPHGSFPGVRATLLTAILAIAATLLAARPATATVYVKAVVDSSLLQSGLGPSLALDALDAPHVAYVNRAPDTGHGAVRYAWWSGTAWVAEDIEAGPVTSGEGTSLALDAQGSPHVTYVMQLSGGGNAIRYARRVAGSWIREDVASGPGLGTFTSLALDAQGHAHLCYFDGYNSAPVYATNASGAWVSQQIGDYYAGYVPWAMLVTSQGQPKLVYSVPFSGAGLRVARRQSNGLWIDETVDATNSLVVADGHAMIDVHDHIHISYRDYTHSISKYAFETGSAWAVELTPVFNPIFGGPIPSPGGLDVAADGAAHLSYTVPSSGPATKIRVAKRFGGVWTVETADNSPGNIGIAALAVDSHGERHLAYPFERIRYSDKRELRYAQSVAGATGRILRVPADHATIQAAIDAAESPDMVHVSPGTYNGLIDFRGKGIVVQSTDGPAVTILDGLQQDAVVLFNSGEDTDAVLEGFTIRNGRRGSLTDGSGVLIAGGSSPTIRGNVITENAASYGGGIVVYGGSPRIEHNQIVSNHGSNGSGFGGGLYLSGSGLDEAQIVGNRFASNDAGSGGAIALFNGGIPLIQDNVFEDNRAGGDGGAIWAVNSSRPVLVQNVFARNQAFRGGAVFWNVPFEAQGPAVIQNTFADNVAQQGSALYLSFFSVDRILIENNVMAGPAGDAAGVLYGDNTPYTPPIFRFNDVYAAGGIAYGGAFADPTGTDGNLSVDPAFADRASGDYRLGAGSPCIDVGDGNAPLVPPLDLRGQPRFQDGDQNGSAVVDIGAYEFGGTPLAADAGDDVERPCSGATTAVQLDGRGSTGDALTFAWSAPGIVFDDSSSPTPTGAFPVGVTEVALVVTSGAEFAADNVRVTIRDASPPSLTVSVSPALLWPPTHNLVAVHVTASAADLCSSNPGIVLRSVRSNEPDAGPGDHSGDVQGAALGTPDFDVQLRAERLGNSTGDRVYTLCYEVLDAAGNTGTACAAVIVPRDQGGRAKLSSGAGGPALVVFGGPGLDVRQIALASIEVRSDDRLTFQATGAQPVFRDADADGAEDAVVEMRRVAPDGTTVPFVAWTANNHGYLATLESSNLAVEGAPLEFAASVTRNPAVGAATLRYGVPRAEHVRLAIYDVHGRCVATLADGAHAAGTHEATFFPEAGAKSQVYFYRYEMAGAARTGKFVIVQ